MQDANLFSAFFLSYSAPSTKNLPEWHDFNFITEGATCTQELKLMMKISNT
jgi:hypothetical protein